MGVSLTDVPDRYDVVFQLNDGTLYGFLLSDALESNLPFRTHKALYSYSPTFLERQNLTEQYGDQFQDFFLTGAQNDWSLGEQQQYFRVRDQDRVRRYWKSQFVDIATIPGQVTLYNTSPSFSFSENIVCSLGSVNNNNPRAFCAGLTTLFNVNPSGTVTNLGVHGAGTPVEHGICEDASFVYISGSTNIIKFNKGTPGFTTFHTGTVSNAALAFLNNQLYAFDPSGALYSFDTAGTATLQYQFKTATGATENLTSACQILPYGGKLVIMKSEVSGGPELWQWDGTGVSLLAKFPANFDCFNICQSNGIIFLAGFEYVATGVYTTIYYYVNGTQGKLWQSKILGNNSIVSSPTLAAFSDGIIFNDEATTSIYRYILSSGGVHCVSTYSGNTGVRNPTLVSALQSYWMILGGSSSGFYFPGPSTSSSGFIQTSLFDFDNTLTKIFRGIKVDATLPAFTSLDLAYQIDSLSGSWTNLQTSATPGTEYFLPAGTTGHSIAVQVTLKSTANNFNPTLKRIYIRAAPTLQQFKKTEYIIDLSGGYRETKGKVSRVTRDGAPYPYSGYDAAQNLIKIATQTIPFTVRDRFNQFTALCDLQQNQAGFDGFAIYEIRPGIFLARINLREV